MLYLLVLLFGLFNLCIELHGLRLCMHVCCTSIVMLCGLFFVIPISIDLFILNLVYIYFSLYTCILYIYAQTDIYICISIYIHIYIYVYIYIYISCLNLRVEPLNHLILQIKTVPAPSHSPPQSVLATCQLQPCHQPLV